MLFRSLIAIEAQELFTLVIDWARAGQERALLVDEKINRLGELMRSDIAASQKKGEVSPK